MVERAWGTTAPASGERVHDERVDGVRRADTSFLICTRNRLAELTGCLESLLVQTVLPRQVVIVDAGERDSRKEFAALVEPGGIELVYLRTEPGRTRQLNLGARECRGDVVIVLDDDVVLESDFHEEILRAFEVGGEGVGGVQGTLLNDTLGSLPKRLFRMIFFQSRHTKDRPGRVLVSGYYTTPVRPSQLREVQALRLGGTAFRRHVFEQFSFDESLEGYAFKEDIDFSYRVSQLYKLIVAPNARFTHLKSPASRIGVREKSRMHINNNYRIFRKNFEGTLRQKLAFAWAISGRLIYECGRSIDRRDPDYIRGALDGVVDIVRSRD